MKRIGLMLFALVALFAGVRVRADEVELTYEVFSMPLRDGATLIRERTGGAAAYQRVLEGVTQKGYRQEGLSIVKIASGTSSEARQVEEVIYPTEYDPPELPSTSAGGLGTFSTSALLLPLPSTPTAFEWKNEGWMVEVKVDGAEEGWWVRTRFTMVDFTQRDEIGKGLGMVEMPRFSIQSLQNSSWVEEGKPVLLGTLSPPRQLQAGKERRIWLLFLAARKSG